MHDHYDIAFANNKVIFLLSSITWNAVSQMLLKTNWEQPKNTFKNK